MAFPTLSYLDIRYDADTLGLSDGAELTTWVDSSGNGGPTLVPTGGPPVFVVAAMAPGYPAVSFEELCGMMGYNATLGAFVNGTNKAFTIGVYGKLPSVDDVTHLVGFGNSASANQFLVAGMDGAEKWQVRKRDNATASGLGVGTPTGDVELVTQSIVFVSYGTTADIFVDNVSVTNDAGFAFSTGAFTANTFTIGGLLGTVLATTEPAGFIRRVSVVNGALGGSDPLNLERAAFAAWLSEPAAFIAGAAATVQSSMY